MEQKILAGTKEGLHVLGGETQVEMAGHEVSCLVQDEAGWWATVDGRELWRRPEGGSWTPVASLEALRANCVLAAVDGPLVGASEGHVATVKGDALEAMASFDETPGRDTWYTPWGGPPDVRSMSASSDGPVYANIHVGGIARSDDGGSWRPTIDIHADVHQVLFDAASGLVLAATARGLAVSDDGGESWTYSTEGLHARYLRSVAVADRMVLIGASTGPRTDHGAVYRRPVKSRGPFARCEKGLPERLGDNVDTHCLAASGAVAAFGTSEGAVYLSSDAGESWETVADALPPVRCVALA